MQTQAFASEAGAMVMTEAEVTDLQVQRTLQRDRILQKAKASGDANRIKKAKQFYNDALKSYKNANYAEAKKSFEAAVLLSPENDEIYFDYGRNLYRLQNYKLALSIFLILENSADFSEEATYYQGLSLFQLKNYDLALKIFKRIQEDEDSDRSPSAALYAGQIYYSQSKFPLAKKAFEFVIEKSKDPKMDQLAEKYLDMVVQQESNLNRQSNRFGYSLAIGLMYDGNVLNAAESNSATSLKAYRLSYGGSLSYNVSKNPAETLSPTFAFSDIYSLNTNFKSDTTIQGTDPMILDFSVPYTFNTSSEKTAGTVRFSPGVQMIYMTKDTTARELVFSNVVTSTTYTKAHSSYFSAAYKLDLSRDQSYLEESSTDDVQTAQKYGFTASGYYLINRNRNENIFLDLSFLLADAEGINAKYKKYLAALGYATSLGGKWSGYAKVDYYLQNYFESTSERKDTAMSGYLGVTYSLGTSDAISLGLLYQNNNSTVDTYKYSKMLVSLNYMLYKF